MRPNCQIFFPFHGAVSVVALASSALLTAGRPTKLNHAVLLPSSPAARHTLIADGPLQEKKQAPTPKVAEGANASKPEVAVRPNVPTPKLAEGAKASKPDLAVRPNVPTPKVAEGAKASKPDLTVRPNVPTPKVAEGAKASKPELAVRPNVPTPKVAEGAKASKPELAVRPNVPAPKVAAGAKASKPELAVRPNVPTPKLAEGAKASKPELAVHANVSTPKLGVHPNVSRIFFHAHIPKAAGEAFDHDVRPLLGPRDKLLSREYCHRYLKQLCVQERAGGRDCEVFFMLRSPREHVMSQYASCSESEWGAAVSAPAPDSENADAYLSVWLQHFIGGFTQENFGCYHPLNMQVRALTCLGNDTHNVLMPEKPYQLDHALKLVNKTRSFGLTEYYTESVCLFLLQANLELPEWCDCNARESQPSSMTPEVPEYSLANVSAHDLLLIDQLTLDDQILYAHAKQKFLELVQEAELNSGIVLLC